MAIITIWLSFIWSLAIIYFRLTSTTRQTAADIPKGSLSAGKCRFIFSEFNIYPRGAGQFVELVRACESEPERVKDVSMKGFKVVFITSDAHLIGVCSLGSGEGSAKASKRSGNSLFYTIGASLVGNADMYTKECQFAYDMYNYIPNRFPGAEDSPVAVALIYNKDPDKILGGIELQKVNNLYKKLAIGFAMEEVIRKNIQDLYVYNTGSPFTSCIYFKTFYTEYSSGKHHILREWGQLDDDYQRGLSRCGNAPSVSTDWKPFQPDLFSYAKLTPGAPNDCSTDVPFLIELEQPKRKKPKLTYDKSGKHHCEITTEDKAIDELDYITAPLEYNRKLLDLIKAREATTQSTVPMDTDPSLQIQEESADDYFTGLEPTTDGGTSQPHPLLQEAFDSDLEHSKPFIWPDCARFPHRQLLQAIEKQSKKAPINPDDILKPGVCNWFDWLVPKKKFRCKFCHRLWNQKIIFDRPGPGSLLTKIITVGQGYMKGKNARYDNRQLIEKHLQNPLHNIAVDYHQLHDSGLHGESLQRAFERPEGPYRQYLNATENTFVSVYQANKLEIPFNKYPRFVQTIEYFNGSLGLLYKNRQGDKTIFMSTSGSLHQEFVEQLKKNRPEVSILMDTSSDVASLYSCAILFQTFDEKGELKVKLYRVLPIKKRETTETLYQLLMDALAEDGLKDWIKEKCVGFGTDGGKNVQNVKNLLNKFTDHDLMYVYCHAHRLERAVTRAWGDVDELNDVDVLANALRRTLNSRSPRKKMVLQAKIIQRGDTNFEIKPVKKIRWVNSKRRALATVSAHWGTIVATLQEISGDKTFPSDDRKTVEGLLLKMTNSEVVATLAFVTDACEQLAKVSLNLQDHGATLIGKKAKREEMKAGLIQLKTSYGPEMKRLLGSAKIETSGTTVASIEELETKDVTIDGVKLSKSPDDVSHLPEKINFFIDNLILEVDSYFPPDPSDDLDVFDARQWPSEQLDLFGNDRLRALNEGLKWNYPADELIAGWKLLKQSISMTTHFNVYEKKKPEDFWAHYLKAPVTWSPALRTIVTNVLTVPASTSHVERVFSHFTALKTVRRYNLDVASVESIIRVIINGPDKIEDFATKVPKYLREFILAGHSRSDDSSRCRTGRLDTGNEDAAECTPGPTENESGEDGSLGSFEFDPDDDGDDDEIEDYE